MAAAPLPPATSPVPEAAPLSEPARIANIFIAPSKTFFDVRRNASWWGPWLVISVFALLFVTAMDRRMGYDQVSRNEIAHSSRADRFDRMSPDQQAQQIKASSAVIRYLSYGIPVTILIYMALMTLVLWATLKFAAGAELSFKRAYAVGFYGGLPQVIGSILGIIAMFAGVDPEGFNVNNPVATNPAYFMDRGGNRFLYGIASSLDVLVIWSIIVMGIGFAVTGKMKRGTAIGIVAGWYLVYKVGMAALAAGS